MPSDKLKTLLDELRQELAKGEALDQETTEMLEAVSSKIDNLIETRAWESSDEIETDASPVATMETLVENFEASHPQAASVVREIMQVLNNIGI